MGVLLGLLLMWRSTSSRTVATSLAIGAQLVPPAGPGVRAFCHIQVPRQLLSASNNASPLSALFVVVRVHRARLEIADQALLFCIHG